MEIRLPKAVIFDMDGVITDSEPIHDEALATILAAHGFSLTKEDKKSILGTTLDWTWRLLQGRLALPGPLEGWKERYSDLVCQLLREKVEPTAGLYDLLAELDQREIRIALASSSPRIWVDIVLQRLNVSHRFQLVVAGDEIERGKPAPDIYLKASHALRIQPTQCIVIEDSPAGLKAARSAGMNVVAVLTPSTGGLDLSDAHQVIPSLQAFDFALLD